MIKNTLNVNRFLKISSQIACFFNDLSWFSGMMVKFPKAPERSKSSDGGQSESGRELPASFRAVAGQKGASMTVVRAS